MLGQACFDPSSPELFCECEPAANQLKWNCLFQPRNRDTRISLCWGRGEVQAEHRALSPHLSVVVDTKISFPWLHVGGDAARRSAL